MAIRRILSISMFFALGSTAFLGTGCNYTQNRVADFSDTIHVGGGIGVGANLRATNYVQLGMGAYGTRFRSDFLNLLTFGIGPEVGLGRGFLAPIGPGGEFGFAPIMYYRGSTVHGESTSRSQILARTLLHGKEDPTWQLWYDPTLWYFYPGIAQFEENYDRRLFDIGASLYLFLGLDLDFNPYELADFFCGFFFLDLSGDDLPEFVPEEMEDS